MCTLHCEAAGRIEAPAALGRLPLRLAVAPVPVIVLFPLTGLIEVVIFLVMLFEIPAIPLILVVVPLVRVLMRAVFVLAVVVMLLRHHRCRGQHQSRTHCDQIQAPLHSRDSEHGPDH